MMQGARGFPHVSVTEHEMPSPHLQRRIREVQVFLAANLDRDVDLQTIARRGGAEPLLLHPAVHGVRRRAPVSLPDRAAHRPRAAAAARDRAHRHADLPPRGLQQPVALHDDVPPAHGVSPSAYRRRRDWEQDAHRFSPLTRALVEQPNKRLTI